MLPESAPIPPPPPPPPPAPSPRGRILLVIGLVAVLGIGAILTAVLLSGDDTTAASTSTTVPTTAPSTSAPATTTTSVPTTTIPTTTLPDDGGYTEEELAYFAEIAGQAEFDGDGGIIHKWTADLRIAVYGEPTIEDWAALDAVIADLNALTGFVNLTVVEADPNVEIYVVPETEFPSIEPEYEPGNQGFVYIWWDGDGAVTDARILVSSTGLTPDERAHLMREELTQSLGLLADSWQYPDSIFYQGWTTVTAFAPIDRAIIEMLYRPEVAPGMSVNEASTILAGLARY